MSYRLRESRRRASGNDTDPEAPEGGANSA